jgi:beta-mannosidase
VHTDLVAAGLLPDPYLDANELTMAWVGHADWRYETTLPKRDPTFERADLVFDGLDTAAQVAVGNQVVGETANMHRSYRFDVTDLLASDSESLSVRFTSAYAAAEANRRLLGDRPAAYREPFNHIRKMACNFGWDWGPTLVTAGIWRAARLEQWSTARLARVRPVVTVADDIGRVEIHLDVERTAAGADRPLVVEVRIGDVRASRVIDAGQNGAAVTVEVAQPQLWWPHTYGDQPRYECVVALRDQDSGAELDSWERRIGFRTIELDTSVDEHGTAFALVVNGERLFARGVNWIPDDTFPSRVGPARYLRRLTQAAEANVDLIRVWGGGIYESDAFYDSCDELGLMVWQDFAFACAAYSEEDPLRREIDAEARENVARLMPHPSLMLWNGNNENLWGFRDWGWEELLDGASWGEGYYLGLLPRIVADVDPTRPYWAGSPWSGSWRRHPNDPDHGVSHSWEVWNQCDYTEYLASVPRFLAEFGWQAPPTLATLGHAIGEAPLLADSPAMLHRQKAVDGDGKLRRGLAAHFDDPTSFDEWHFLTQVNQARAVALGVEHWRSQWPVCAGTVLWQLNDCWPAISWAAIDNAGRAKPLYHELRRLYADRLLTFQRRDGRLAVAVVNQSREPWAGTLDVRRIRVDGSVVVRTELAFAAAGQSVAVVDVPPAVAETHEGKEFLVVDGAPLRAWWFPDRDRDFAYPEARFEVAVLPADGGRDVLVTARTLIRDLYLQADRLAPDATADRGLTTLLPGEQVTIHVEGWHGATAELLAARALWCVNGMLPGTASSF